MIQHVKVTNHLGEILLLELRRPEQSGFFIKGIDGLGPAKTIVNMTESTLLDGASYNSSRVTNRNIVLDLGFYNGGADSIETIRQQTYRFFPLKKPITIEVQTDNRLGITTGYVESNEPDIFSNAESTIISILCPSAYFSGGNLIDTVFSGVESLFEFPWENPSLTESLIEFGSVYIDTIRSVFYTGDEDTGVVIYVDVMGPVNDLTIFNVSTAEVMAISSAQIIALTGSDLVAGDRLIISTGKGQKFIHLVRAGVTTNILNALGSDADWFTIQRGDNLFTYEADSGVDNLQFLIQHRLVYQGV